MTPKKGTIIKIKKGERFTCPTHGAICGCTFYTCPKTGMQTNSVFYVVDENEEANRMKCMDKTEEIKTALKDIQCAIIEHNREKPDDRIAGAIHSIQVILDKIEAGIYNMVDDLEDGLARRVEKSENLEQIHRGIKLLKKNLEDGTDLNDCVWFVDVVLGMLDKEGPLVGKPYENNS